MQAICAGLETYVDDRSRLPAIVCWRILLQIELLNGVDGKNGRRIARDPGAIDDRLSGIGLAVK